MSILEDLELLDLPDDLPYMTDFDLDDILFEFSTPGLFTAPEAPAPVMEAASAEEEMLPEEPTAEPCVDIPIPEPLIPMEEAAEALCEQAEEFEEAPVPVLSKEEPEITEELFGDPIGDILYEFGTPTDEEGVKVYTPASKAQPVEEEDVKVYVPVKEEPVRESISEETIPFTALQAEALPEIEVPSAPEAAAIAPAPKAPGLFAKAAGLLMGLFAKKKAAAPAVQPAEEPVTEEDPFPVSLFEDWNDEEEEEDIPAAEAEEAPMANFFDETVQFSLFDEIPAEAEEAPAAEVTEEAAEDRFTEALQAEVELLFAEDTEDAVKAVEIAEEVLLPADTMEEPSEAEEAVFSFEEIVAELSDIPLEEIEEAFTAKEEPVPVAEEADPVDLLMAELIDAAMESLHTEDAPAEAPAEVLPEVMEAEDFSITEDFSVEEIVAELSDAMPSFDMGDTIPFTAISDISVSAPEAVPVPAAVQPAKGPGVLAKAAGLVMGLFAGLKKKPAAAPAPVQQPAPAEEDPFFNMAELFAADDTTADSDLMLELELLAEMEAEKEATQAAWEAEELIVSIPEAEQEVPEAIALLQQEAEDAAELARLEAEREAAELAALEAAKEEAMLAQAEEELFEWIESTNKIRGKAIAKEELPAFDREEEEIPVYTTHAELPEEAPAAPVSAPVLTEAEEQQPTIALTDEESSAEILSLLENPDTEQSTAAETEEEAAARRAKEEEDLRYVPDEAPAKAIGSHIGKRLGAAFAAFTNAATDHDDEEALGPEVTSTKAYKYFNQFVNGYRFRLRLSAALCVVMGWLALGLPVFGSLKNPAVSAAMCLMILLTVMLAGVDILVSGTRGLITKRPGIHSLVTVSCVASVIDAIAIIITKGAGGYLPFCAVSAVSMCFAIYGSLLYCRSQRLNFKTLEQCAEPLTISVDYGIVDEETTTVYRTIGAPESYIHRSEEEDLSETVYGIITPMLMVGIPVLALFAALISGHFGDFFHILAALFAASASFSALVAFPLPYFLTQRDLYSTKAAIAGWAGTKEIGKVSSMVVTDRDLFPDETVSIKSVRIVDEVNPELTLSYFCSMIKKSGSCLVPAFDQLAENNDCQIREVENFQCHEAGGLSGNIGPDEVLIASHSYMKLRGFRIPARKKDSENALFMAANGHVIAYIVVEYKPIKSVRAGLESALRGSVEMVFAARDFNITPMLIAKKFKSPTDTLRFPSYSQRYEITDHSDSETAVCAAVVSRKSFYSYAAVVEKARYLYRSVTLAVALSAISTVLGVLLMFIMALTGAGLTVGRLLIFMLLWLVPTLALAVSISK